MRTLSDVLRKVEDDFLNDRHLDLTPYQPGTLVKMSVTTATDLRVAPDQLKAMFDGDTVTYAALEAERLAAKPSPDEMQTLADMGEAIRREKREKELLLPVTRVEVEFVDNFQTKTDWNFTYAMVDDLSLSPEFVTLTLTAAVKKFGLVLQTAAWLNTKGQRVLKAKLVFTALGAADRAFFAGEVGRTFSWMERP